MPNHSEDATHAWDLMEQIRTCMLVTHSGIELRSRPMFAHVDRMSGKIYFLSDVRHYPDNEIEDNGNICLTFVDTDNQKYVSVSGTASVSNDLQKIKYLWSPQAEEWWDNEEDPSIRILTIVPTIAEYWESAGSIVSTFKMVAAAIKGEKPDLVDNAKVNL